ncbi:MAG: hypothetical protein IJ968_09405 [Clostridia bacterium]|nr:hypothetical protein [Clostridia bacterium]
MKKLFALLLCCLMVMPLALADEMEETPVLSMEELEMYKENLWAQAMAGEIILEKDQNGQNVAITAVGDLTITGDAPEADTYVRNARLSVHQPGPRGLMIGDSLDMIFQVYPNDNPALVGNYYEATLCIWGEEPEVMLGYALRNGQRVTEVTYAVYNWQADGIVKSGITFHLDQGYIQQINVFTAPELMTQEEVLSDINDSAAVQEDDEYFAYPVSENGAALDPFCREDLVFSGMDFYALTPDKAITALGNAQVDEWNQDTDGTWLRLMQWDGITLIAKYDTEKKFSSVYSLTITNEEVEGPRGLRTGDYIDMVLFRFRHSEGSAVENGVILYGDGENAPFGKITYGTDTDTLVYTEKLDQGSVMLYLTFNNDILQEIQLFNN